MIKKMVLDLVILGCISGDVMGMQTEKYTIQKSSKDVAVSSVSSLDYAANSSSAQSLTELNINDGDVLTYDELQSVLHTASKKKFANNFKESLKLYEQAFWGRRNLGSLFSVLASASETDVQNIQKKIVTGYAGEREAVKSLVYLCEALYGANSVYSSFWSTIARRLNVVIK